MKKQVQGKGYIFLSIDKDGGENATQNGVIVKTNKEFKIIDVMETELFTKESAEKFIKLIESPIDYRVVCLSYEDFAVFSKCLEKYMHELPRDFVRIVKSRFWNLQNEIIYRLKCPNHFDLDQLSELYGITPNPHPLKHVGECLQLVMLAKACQFDKTTNSKIIKDGYEKVLRERYVSESTDKLMDLVFQKGFQLTFEKGLFQRGKGVHATARKNGFDIEVVGESIQNVLAELRLKLFMKKTE
ncbi:hypothetical protein SMD22_00125 (plasmid) [Brevibacillus halotolerans]|nr:hypothetical protein SMD22_00125 [Brevibacillus halotolerans]